jgi:hypothetical protein
MGGRGSGSIPKGETRNPEGNGRRNWTPSKTAQYWELKTAMRELCPEAVEVVKRCLRSDDDRIALAAAEIAFERGFGKAVVHADVEVNHRFVVAPDRMEIGAWLERRGQPVGASGDAWLAEQRQRTQPERRTGEAATQTAKPSSGPVIDAVAEPEADPLLLAEDPTAPCPDPTKLN